MQEIILDERTTAREFNHNLKRIFKDELKMRVHVRIINSYNWPKVAYVEVRSNEIIPNDIRKLAVIQTYGKLSTSMDVENINYGNTRERSISISPTQWNAVFAEYLEKKKIAQ